MALVGSGSYAVQNVTLDLNVSSGHLDTSVAAIVEQLGGVAWQDGEPVLMPGNLGAANFATGLNLPDSNKLEPKSIVPIFLLVAPMQPDSAVTSSVVGASPAPFPGTLVAVTFGQSSWGTVGPGSFLGTFRLTVTINGLAVGRSEVIEFTDYLGSHAIEIGRDVLAGDVIGVSMTDVSGTGSNVNSLFVPTTFMALMSTDHV